MAELIVEYKKQSSFKLRASRLSEISAVLTELSRWRAIQAGTKSLQRIAKAAEEPKGGFPDSATVGADATAIGRLLDIITLSEHVSGLAWAALARLAETEVAMRIYGEVETTLEDDRFSDILDWLRDSVSKREKHWGIESHDQDGDEADVSVHLKKLGECIELQRHILAR